MTILLLTVILLAFTATAGEATLLAILGVAGTYISQFLKKYAGTGGNKALFLTIGICLGLALLANYWDEWSANAIFRTTLNIFALATLAYRLLLSKDSLVRQEPAA